MRDLLERWYRQSREQWNGLREVPLRRLWVLLLGAFLLFFNVGYHIDLLRNGVMPYPAVFAIGALSGLDAVLWILVLRRSWLPLKVAMAILQFFLQAIGTFLATTVTNLFHLSPVAPATGIRFAGQGMFWTAILGYVSLLRYIRVAGVDSLLFRKELELAHEIQRTLVPVLSLHTDGFEVYGISKPSEKVGGDLVDAVLLPHGDIVAYLADIAGHGLAASILMGRVKTAIRTALLDANEEDAHHTLPVLLRRINTVLPQVKSASMYATFTGFRLTADGQVFFALAASPPILHWHAGERMLSQTQIPQLPLGLLPVSHFEGYALQMDPQDILLVATDGILEVCNNASEEFGADRIVELVQHNCSDPLQLLSEKIHAAVDSFGPQQDDQTLLLIRRIA